jgi:hypothetical protein
MNHIEETKKFLNSIKGGYRPNPEDEAEVHALIAIAEQLRIANLIRLDILTVDEIPETGERGLIFDRIDDTTKTDAIAETLGIKEES